MATLIRLDPDAASPRDLVLSAERRWIRTPENRRVELERHRSLWLVVACLASVHERAPGQAVPVDALLRAGWPDERVRHDAGQRRVYTALSTLRRLGLRGEIVRRVDGYLLAPDLTVRWSDGRVDRSRRGCFDHRDRP